MWMAKFWVSLLAGLALSLTIAVRLKSPVAVGVPEIMPVPAFRVKPAGRLPVEMLQVYGDIPPVACTVAL